MERLTEPGGSRCEGCQDTGECAYIAGEFPVPCPDAVRYERLKVYENTGLEPENLQSSVVRHGYWIPISDGDGAECSECGEYFVVSDGAGMTAFRMFRTVYKFCPHCGALMDLEG